MSAKSEPPKTYRGFVARYPKLAQAWDAMADAGADGPLDKKDTRLIKLAISIGAMREGAVHSNVRKALDLGIDRAEIEQVVALAASTLGMPSTVAIYSWVQDVFESRKNP